MNLAEWATPFTRFAQVYEAAHRAVPKDPNAMTLATVDAQGRPSLRTVLLKDFDERGFVFYTNTRSAKGRALHATNVAALNFYWPAIDQQVRVEGTVEPVTPEEADAYFATRARASQLGVTNEYVKKARENLSKYLPDEFPYIKDERIGLEYP